MTGSMTKWGFPTGPLGKPATQQMAVCDPLSSKYNKHPMWNRCMAIHIKRSSQRPFCSSITAASRGSWDGWLWPGRGLPIFRDRSRLCRGRERKQVSGPLSVRPSSDSFIPAEREGNTLNGTMRSDKRQASPQHHGNGWQTAHWLISLAALRSVQSGGETPASFLFFKPPESHAQMFPHSYLAF